MCFYSDSASGLWLILQGRWWGIRADVRAPPPTPCTPPAIHVFIHFNQLCFVVVVVVVFVVVLIPTRGCWFGGFPAFSSCWMITDWGAFLQLFFHLGYTHPHTCATTRNNQWINVSESVMPRRCFCFCRHNLLNIRSQQWRKYRIAINLNKIRNIYIFCINSHVGIWAK